MKRLYALTLPLALGCFGWVAAQENQTEKSPAKPLDEPCGQFLMRIIRPAEIYEFKLTVKRPREDTDYKLRVINPCPESTEGLSILPEPRLRRESRKLKPPASFKFQIEPPKNPDELK